MDTGRRRLRVVSSVIASGFAGKGRTKGESFALVASTYFAMP